MGWEGWIRGGSSSRSILLAHEVGAVAVLGEKNMGHTPIAVEDANAESTLHNKRGQNEQFAPIMTWKWEALFDTLLTSNYCIAIG